MPTQLCLVRYLLFIHVNFDKGDVSLCKTSVKLSVAPEAFNFIRPLKFRINFPCAYLKQE